MLLKGIIIFYLCFNLSNGHKNIFDTYTGQLLSPKQLRCYTQGQIENCTAEVKPCDPNEGRRVDGSCNNLKFPTGGIYFQHLYRVLPAQFHNGYFQRLTKSGKELTLARKVRTSLLKASQGSHLLFNHNVPGFGAFIFIDSGSIHDIEFNVLYHTSCCQKEHMNDYECTPNIVPIDDPVHRFSGIRCMNSTRPLTYQDYGCTKDPVPSPIAKSTPAFDLSQIYNQYNKGEKAIRAYSGGLLKTEEEDGQEWPPNGPVSACRANQGSEKRCFANHVNGLLPLSLFIVLFVNHHNYLARQLTAVNPFWDDNKLFDVARDINIAYNQQLILDWLEVLEGRENLVQSGILSEHEGFRDLYDESLYPTVSVEYTFGLRWFHLLQESRAKLYTPDDQFIEEYPLLNLTFRPGYLAHDKNFGKFVKSTYMGSCHGGPHTVDYDMAERGAPSALQLSMDTPAGDLNKGRNFGIPPYIDYVHYCTGKTITSFEDLCDYISEENIIQLKENYDDVGEVDLMAGMWLEKYMKGGHIPHTLACILNESLLRSIKSDRHYFERDSRPNAFTLAQLLEIRKTGLATLFCTVGKGVSKVPRNAFLNISPENPLVSCCEIPTIDFSLWADETC